MTVQRPDFSEICAYVDGELDAAAAARVAYAAARDPATAAQIAQITKLKAVTPAAIPGPDADWIETLHVRRRAAPGPASRRRLLAAAAVAGLLLLSGAVATLDGWHRPPPGFLPVGAALHRAWSTTVDANPQMPQPAALDRRAFAPPDLSAAQLTLAASETFTYASATIFHFGYVGSRGCRLSLFVQLNAAAGFGEGTGAPGLRTAAWLHGDIGYLVIADGMDEQHFRTVASAVQRYSIEGGPFEKSVEQRLAESRAQSRPCLA